MACGRRVNRKAREAACFHDGYVLTEPQPRCLCPTMMTMMPNGRFRSTSDAGRCLRHILQAVQFAVMDARSRQLCACTDVGDGARLQRLQHEAERPYEVRIYNWRAPVPMARDAWWCDATFVGMSAVCRPHMATG